MLDNITKNLLGIILILCFLFQGCNTQKTRYAKYDKEKGQFIYSDTPFPTEVHKVEYNVKDLSKEELEQKIQECEKYFIDLRNPDPSKPADEQLAQTIGAIFMPIMLVTYLGAKLEYTERYGTVEQKQLIEDIKASSDDSTKQLAELFKALDMHPAVYETFDQPQFPENSIDEDELQNILSDKIQNQLEAILKE